MVFMLHQHFCMARTFELPTGKLHIPSCYISHHQLIEQVFLYHCWLKQSSLLPIRFRKWHYWLGGGNKHLTIMYHPNKGHNKTSFELPRHCSFPIPLSINTIKEGERKAFTLCLNHRDISFRHVSSNVWLKVSFDFLQAINMLHVCNWAKKKRKGCIIIMNGSTKRKNPAWSIKLYCTLLGEKALFLNNEVIMVATCHASIRMFISKHIFPRCCCSTIWKTALQLTKVMDHCYNSKLQH